MTPSFVGRATELAELAGAWTGPRSAFIPIYGRRRTGKSRLIVEFAVGKPAIYHVGKQGPAPLQRREFLQLAAVTLDEPLLAQVPVETWAEAFRLVDERWKGPGKLLIALDEFQWTTESSPELPSVIQEAWDRRWQKSGKIMLILCGSYLGFMEREVLGKKSPLFGRRTAQLLLRPFGFRESAAFHPGWSHADHAQAYFVCGGLPAYLECFDRDRSIEQNLAANFSARAPRWPGNLSFSSARDSGMSPTTTASSTPWPRLAKPPTAASPAPPASATAPSPTTSAR